MKAVSFGRTESEQGLSIRYSLCSVVAACALFLLLLGFGTRTLPVAAADAGQKVTITPFLQTVTLPAEEATKSFAVTLTNNAASAQDFTLTTVDFGSLDETGGLVYAGADASKLVKKYGLASWVRLSAERLRIEPGKSQEITATIINDVDLTPGGHYGAIIAEVGSTKDIQDNTIEIKQKISSLIFATKTGGESYKLSLQDFTHNGTLFKLPSRAVLNFYNSGNVHVIPRGSVQVKNAAGEVLLKGVINESSSYVLPETSRQITAELRKTDSRIVLPGKYHVEAVFRYDGYEGFSAKEKTFLYISWAVVAVLALIVCSIVFIYRFKRSKKPLKNSRK